MNNYTQSEHLLEFESPLGKDKLILTSVAAYEAISQLFKYQLDLFSSDHNIDPKSIVGKQVSFAIKDTKKNSIRYFSGFVNQFCAKQTQLRGMRKYSAEIVPWLWFLTQTSDCLIFQNKTTKQIIEDIFKQFGFNDYSIAGVTNSASVREYCVQYKETAFNFISRLMEEEGIYYYFEHKKGKHTLVLADNVSGYGDISEGNAVYSSGNIPTDQISYWEHQYHFCSGKLSQTDYNFETPKIDLLTTTNTIVKLPNINKYERFDYPGKYEKKSDGETKIKNYMEAEETQYEEIKGEGSYPSFSPGKLFTLKTHDISKEEGKYVLTSVQHEISDDSYFTGEATKQHYSNVFTCVPKTVLYRPLRRTEKPIIQGLQTGIVVGPSGEEIYTDKYGRIKVQFHWDRKGKKNEKSSCWMRIAQIWAGKKWGAIFIPRVGQEVTISFLNGDPDRPLVTGSVYNSEYMPPYDLPGNMTQSGIKTHSSKEGKSSDSNELRFEDKKDAEEVFFHAQKDFNRVVENDDTLKVNNDQTINIKQNRTETVEEGDEVVTIKKGKKTATIETGDNLLEVKKGNNTINVDTGNHETTVKQGNHAVTVSMGNETRQIKQGNRTIELSMGNDTLNIKMGNQVTKLSLGKSSTEAMQGIELKVGQSSIKVDQMGVEISGMKITINGQLMTEIKAGAMLTLKGGITMIN